MNARETIINARKNYPNSTYADLYDDLTMPSDLRKAHQENDKAVMEQYGLKYDVNTENDILSLLFDLYEKAINQ